MSDLFGYSIREYRNGRFVKDGWYFNRKYTRAHAIKYAKKIFKKNLQKIKKEDQRLLKEYEASFADEPYISKPKKTNYRVVIYYFVEDETYAYNWRLEMDGKAIAAWDSEYGRNGRMLTPHEKNQLPNYRRSDEL